MRTIHRHEDVSMGDEVSSSSRKRRLSQKQQQLEDERTEEEKKRALKKAKKLAKATNPGPRPRKKQVDAGSLAPRWANEYIDPTLMEPMDVDGTQVAEQASDGSDDESESEEDADIEDYVGISDADEKDLLALEVHFKQPMSLQSRFYHCKLASRDAFPLRATADNWAIEAWDEACQEMEVNLEITTGILKLIRERTSQMRSDVKTKLTTMIEVACGFETSKAEETLAANVARVQELMKDNAFLYKTPERKGTIYQNPLIQRAINVSWFRTRRPKGHVWRVFQPLPVPSTGTGSHCDPPHYSMLAQWGQGDNYEALYRTYVTHLIEYEKNGKRKGVGRKMRESIYAKGRHHAGLPTLEESRSGTLLVPVPYDSIMEAVAAATASSQTDDSDRGSVAGSVTEEDSQALSRAPSPNGE
ncbi:hypothetical protein BC834DRAFT_847683 [Gloeopeniophorella convolvens]|nr:hypothetical protein BC834DRAFT_847683 [Gloeopeniophorella convolvens]